MSNQESPSWTSLPHGKVGNKELAEKLSQVFGGNQEEWYKELTPEQKIAREEILAKPLPENDDNWSYLPTPQRFLDLIQKDSESK